MIIRLFSILFLLSMLGVQANDLGKEVVGRLEVNIYFATNGDAAIAGASAKKLAAPMEAKLRALKSPRFASYRFIGNDRQPVFRSYENWLTPIKGSDELLLSFEPRGEVKNGKLMLDLEFWQSKKKIMKAGPTLSKGKPLYIFGPKWRGGRLIMEIQLVELVN